MSAEWSSRPTPAPGPASSPIPASSSASGKRAKPRSAPPPSSRGQPEHWPGWEDSAVPPDKLGAYLRELEKLFAAHGYTAALYGHFGDGVTHCRINFDFHSRAGAGELSPVHARGGAARAQLRRIAVGRAWRRPGARRAAEHHVRRRARPSFSRVQGDLGSGQPAQSGQGDRAFPDRFQPQARPHLSPEAARHLVQVSRRPRLLRPCDDALRRSREMPAAAGRRRSHVPVLSRHGRGEALHAWRARTCSTK